MMSLLAVPDGKLSWGVSANSGNTWISKAPPFLQTIIVHDAADHQSNCRNLVPRSNCCTGRAVSRVLAQDSDLHKEQKRATED
jgi:hypothetical protein